MGVCRQCGQLVEDTRVLCPYCYTPIKSTAPLIRQPQTIVTFAIVLGAVVMFVVWLVHRWMK